MKKTEKLRGGPVTHSHSDKIIKVATDELREYFEDGESRTPGELEDKFAGQWSIDLTPWRSTPHFPALGRMVDSGEISYFEDMEGAVWYHKTKEANSTRKLLN